MDARDKPDLEHVLSGAAGWSFAKLSDVTKPFKPIKNVMTYIVGRHCENTPALPHVSVSPSPSNHNRLASNPEKKNKNTHMQTLFF